MGLVGKVNLHASMDQQLVVIREADRYRTFTSDSADTLLTLIIGTDTSKDGSLR